MAFKQMYNIANYLKACTDLGMPSGDLFATVALFEGQDMSLVLKNIHSLGRVAQSRPGFSGPTLGAKLAVATPRQFGAETIAQGKATSTFLGKGSHGHATQSGMIDYSKQIDKQGHINGLNGLGKSAGSTFIMTGSHGCYTNTAYHATDRPRPGMSTTPTVEERDAPPAAAPPPIWKGHMVKQARGPPSPRQGEKIRVVTSRGSRVVRSRVGQREKVESACTDPL